MNDLRPPNPTRFFSHITSDMLHGTPQVPHITLEKWGGYLKWVVERIISSVHFIFPRDWSSYDWSIKRFDKMDRTNRATTNRRIKPDEIRLPKRYGKGLINAYFPNIYISCMCIILFCPDAYLRAIYTRMAKWGFRSFRLNVGCLFFFCEIRFNFVSDYSKYNFL